MPKFNIDGKEYEFEGKKLLLQYTFGTEVEIPYFCYHPAMTVPTNCRMCLVEVGYQRKNRETGEWVFDENQKPVIDWGRKPATACNTQVSEGMFVKTRKTSEVVKTAQEGVLEYLLVNHPLDCPICDQAGECPLQIWTYKYGPEGSRFEESKVHKPKRVELGPNVILDAERCINCTRCTRFTEEISHSHQLTIISRGDKNHPSTAPGVVFDDPYSMNVIDLCPVGALTARQSRFKARAWEMNSTPSICNGCSKGCNTYVWIRDNKVIRHTPKENLSINQYWMCDAGRLNTEQYTENRVSGAKLKGDIPVVFENGLRKAADLIKHHNKGRILFVGSAFASAESNFALKELSKKIGKDNELIFAGHSEKGWGDNFLRRDDRTPNAASCRLMGFKEVDTHYLKEKLHLFEMYIVIEDNIMLKEAGEILSHKPGIVFATHYFENSESVEVLLPAANHIESQGIYINDQNVPQYVRQVKEVRQMTPEMWMGLSKSRLDKGAVYKDKWRDIENVFDVMSTWKMIDKISEMAGVNLGYETHKEIFGKMKHDYEVFKNMKISYKIPKESFKNTQFEFAIT
ncbi:MAG: 2Fe-2S iron-sulfur cluster binding domain-containing protein [Bacteroidia bacterium]|nr:2Fe-2S iron-sulfur cluster binding domain-containing protein [Bacteroidia bacterium]